MTGEGKAKNIWLILGGIFGIVFLLYVCIALYFIGHFYINTKKSRRIYGTAGKKL